jgi:hypothetical protein
MIAKHWHWVGCHGIYFDIMKWVPMTVPVLNDWLPKSIITHNVLRDGCVMSSELATPIGSGGPRRAECNAQEVLAS